MGPGLGDTDVFEAEHADNPDPAPFIGFRPTHAVNVIAMANRAVDHTIATLLTATVMNTTRQD
ncbi:hypothetical protein SSP24_13640 [Streptomyces spinoverrucosus]|uniref:Uncharacterized protein n=2 Tax=Streptomyces spinoverrucosus TaxID=284043 RepID=A0A4Y3VDE8_9ACTN|nr:hypothetical protein SSP24_13640 [Streptomyces spinoverrucosus]GHB50731.1 hypothetical protein GCM10010397_21030 [Streptomyces spinoverrucosus]